MSMSEEPEQQPQSGQQPPEEADSETSSGEDSLSPEDFENDPAYNPGDEALKDIKGG
jgi:hypothetical protein